MKKSVGSTSRKQHEFPLMDKPLEELLALRKKRERVAFNKVLKKVVPELRNYIQRRLTLAIENEQLDQGKYKVDDLVDEVYLRAFAHLEKVQEEEYLYSWVFKTAEQVLEEFIIETDFDRTFYQNIEEYIEKLWKEMEEEPTRDADGDLVLVEDLDDPSYSIPKYTLQDFLQVDEEEELLQRIGDAMQEEKLQNDYKYLLKKIPWPLRHLFDLSVIEGFSSEEIAFIKQADAEEVGRHLHQLRKGFRSIINRHFLNA